MDIGVEIPQYFLCPISLQIIKDPVTTVTGITYDRENIERWLVSDNTKMCPVTNQPPPQNSDLTPNHTVRRLIQTWCTFNGVDRIPTPRAPANHGTVLELLDDLSIPGLVCKTLNAIEKIASDGERDRLTLVRAGVGSRLVALMISNHNNNIQNPDFIAVVAKAVRILTLIRAWSEEHSSWDDHNLDIPVNSDVIESMTRVLKSTGRNDRDLRSSAILLLRSLVQFTVGNGTGNSSGIAILERLKPELFEVVVQVLRDRMDPQTTKAALQVLLLACPYGSNKTKIIESGAVVEIIETELVMTDKRTSELDLSILNQLCSCADGRAQFLGHKAAIAMTTKRILRVSPAADEMAVGILASIGKHSANNELLYEMLRVGGVSKLCMVLQANCSYSVKQKARLVLKLHSNVWRDSPCISVYLLTRDPHH